MIKLANRRATKRSGAGIPCERNGLKLLCFGPGDCHLFEAARILADSIFLGHQKSQIACKDA